MDGFFVAKLKKFASGEISTGDEANVRPFVLCFSDQYVVALQRMRMKSAMGKMTTPLLTISKLKVLRTRDTVGMSTLALALGFIRRRNSSEVYPRNPRAETGLLR
jgi:hypothetical protein